jgi:transposase InsO family protein
MLAISPAIEFRNVSVEFVDVHGRAIIEEWRIDYNTNRPHTSLNGLTPTEFAARPDQGHNRNKLSL